MATHAADPTEPDDSGTATLERKRPYDLVSSHNPSNTSSPHLPSRKRAKNAGKLGRQDVRDFVPVGASFSTSVVPIDETQDSGDDGSQAEASLRAGSSSDFEEFQGLDFEGTEQQKALMEGRRLLVKDLAPDITEKHLIQLFEGYSIERIWLPDRKGDNPQMDISAQKESISTDGDSFSEAPVEGTATADIVDGYRLYVGNLSFTATEENLREFFRGFSIGDITIPTNPRTCRPVGYAFITVSNSDEADRAISQLSGSEILGRRISIQRSRAEQKKAPDTGITVAKEVASTTGDRHKEGYTGNTVAEVAEKIEETELLHGVPEAISLQDVKAAPPVNWNAVNTVKIRTSLGGSVGKVRDSSDEPNLTNVGGKKVEEHSKRDIATSVALERVEALRFRLSSLNPHDGPVSAHHSAQQELHDAEVDYNYCLYYPSKDAFQSPPSSIARKSPPRDKDSREYRLRLWSIVERCMKEGTLQDLKEGKIPVSKGKRLNQPPPSQIEQVHGQRYLQTPLTTDPKQVQTIETQEMDQKQQSYLEALSNTRPGTSDYETLKKSVHETEIHLNYCKFFPVTEEYLPLALAKGGLNRLDNSQTEDTRASELRAAQILKLVEQCSQDGKLQDLKDGRFAAWLEDVPPQNQSFFAPALQEKYTQETIAPEFKPPHGGGPKGAGNGNAGTSADTRLIPVGEESSDDRQDDSKSERGVILNLDYGNQGSPFKIDDEDIPPIMKLESEDGEVLSGVEDKDPEQGLPATNPVDDDIYASDSLTPSNGDTENNDSSMVSEGQSEDGDAMMQYSNSEQIGADEGGRNQKTPAVPPTHKASTLADLSPYDLNAQLRYFHTTKARGDVDGKTPVRCLVCAKEGHMAGVCEILTCSVCGAFNRHTTQACPSNAKCRKCREQEHDETNCPYKLKKLSSHEIVCDLCQRNGHIEEDCELLWRTSGRPWESDLAHAKVRFSCYECGHSGHLGNGCPSRKPNKEMGTSTWDGNIGPVSIKSMREIKIKGKATRQDPINFDDSDDERANFYRPKISVPEPVRKGQIRIVTGRHESTVYEPSSSDRAAYAYHRNGSFTPINVTYRNDEARQPYQEYRDRDRGNWRAVDAPEHAIGYDNLRSNHYRPNERRSRSPPYRNYEGYPGGSSWPPPRPAPRTEHRATGSRADANVYRPMPSAAHSAWIRRRL